MPYSLVLGSNKEGNLIKEEIEPKQTCCMKFKSGANKVVKVVSDFAVTEGVKAGLGVLKGITEDLKNDPALKNKEGAQNALLGLGISVTLLEDLSDAIGRVKSIQNEEQKKQKFEEEANEFLKAINQQIMTISQNEKLQTTTKFLNDLLSTTEKVVKAKPEERPGIMLTQAFSLYSTIKNFVKELNSEKSETIITQPKNLMEANNSLKRSLTLKVAQSQVDTLENDLQKEHFHPTEFTFKNDDNVSPVNKSWNKAMKNHLNGSLLANNENQMKEIPLNEKENN